MSYWKRARAWAWRDTNLYSPKKAIPSVMIAAIQYAFSQGTVQQRLLLSIPIIVGTYIVLWAGEFFWKLLISAPVALDLETQKKNEDLQNRLEAQISKLEDEKRQLQKPTRSAADEGRISLLRAVIEKRGEWAASALKHLGTHGKVTFAGDHNGSISHCVSVLPVAGMNQHLATTLSDLEADGIVRRETTKIVGGMGQATTTQIVFEIAPGFLPVLDEAVYPNGPHPPTP